MLGLLSGEKFMFCNACGQPLAAGQNFCAKCGQPVGVAVIPRRINRVAEHTKLLGVLWIVYSLLDLAGGAFMMVIANTIFLRISSQMHDNVPPIADFVHPLLSAIAFFILVKGVAGILAGAGLLQRASWARILTLVLAFISLINIPFGTALGIYSIWVLLSADADKQYEAMAASG
jgi:hypothetical protein